MIRKIVIEGVRTHEHTEIDLGRLTCLVGPNGSGKSTVLLAFQAVMGDLRFESWLRTGVESSKIAVEDDGGSRLKAGRVSRMRRGPSGSLAAFPFRLDSEVLRGGSEFTNGKPKLGANGRQLAAVLAAWKLSDNERFQTVLNQLKQIVPTLDDLRPSLAEGEKSGFELLFDYRSGAGIPAQAVSEGTLFSLGLLTAIHEVGSEFSVDKSTVLLLDDIDRGLHPDAQVELVGLLRKLAEEKHLQIVMTTHSPYIVDALAPEEVCVLALDETGTTRARKLSEIPGAERYRGMLSTGELWSSHGESWVLEEQAKQKSA